MTDTPLDPRHARLVALLYDELPPEEADRLRTELATDAELRDAWLELNGARRILGAWDVEETAPSFVLLDPSAAAGDRRTVVPPRRRGASRIVGLAGWALAACAFLLFGIAGRGLRVERLHDGFSLRLGREALVSGSGDVAVVRDTAPTTGWTPFAFHPGAAIQTVSAVGDSYVTARALEAHTEQLMELFGRVISEDRARQQREFTSLVRGVYGDLNERQFAGYRDLRGRIEAVDVGLKLGQSGTVRNPDGTTMAAIVDTLEETKAHPRLPIQRGWRLGDFPNDPERP